MSTSTTLATLRATNCYRLTALNAHLVAALGPRTSYVFAADANADHATSDVFIPKEAASYALWAPTASADASLIYVVYTTDSDAGARNGLRLLRANQSESAAITVSLATTSHTSPAQAEDEIVGAEEIRSLRVFFQSVLVVERESSVQLYLLDASAVMEAASSSTAVTVPLLGTFRLSPAAQPRGQTETLIVPNSTTPSPGSQEVLIACFDQTHHTLSVQMVAVSSTHASLVRTTDVRRGLTVPPALHCPLVAWTVHWAAQELVMLCRDAPRTGAEDEEGGHREDAQGATHCAALSLRRADMAAGNQLTRWVAQPSFVNAATRPLLALASDIQCCGEGMVYIVDSTTGPNVVLRNIASAGLEEVMLANTNTTAKILCASKATVTGDDTLYVLAGRNAFAISAAASASLGAASSTTPARPTSAATTSAASRLRQQLLPAGADQTSRAAGNASDIKDEAQAMLAAILKKGNAWREVAGPGSSVVRDAHFVWRTTQDCIQSTSSGLYHHALLESPTFTALKQTEKIHVVMRYVAAAESVHPYTTFVAFAAVPATAATATTEQDQDGARLALAVLLSRKNTLQAGGLQRHAELSSAASSFARDGGVIGVGAQKALLAALCRTATTALAVGALGAASVLHTVADALMTQLYGRHHQRESRPREQSGTEVDTEASLEQSIAASIALMKQYSNWALADAATSLGTISSHIGDVREGRKEAYLRDAQAHPIITARNVDIKNLRLGRTSAASPSSAPQ